MISRSRIRIGRGWKNVFYSSGRICSGNVCSVIQPNMTTFLLKNWFT